MASGERSLGWREYVFCGETLSESSSIIVYEQVKDLFAADFSNESCMNAAGRTTMHPYRDMRSTSYARKHARRYADNGPRTRSIGGRKWEQAHRRRENKRQKRDTLRDEIQANQRREKVWSPGKPKNIEFVVWDVNLEEEFDQYIVAMEDDVIRYEKLHKNAEVFESPQLYSETGETFSVWAQRRIAEMRAVKESRMETQLAPRQKLMVYETGFVRWRRMGVPRFNYNVYCGTALTTTLPTNTYDAYGHALLRTALTQSKWARQQARFNPTMSLFPRIVDYNWFGEYTWRWHRNASGCWQIGYGECYGCAIPCSCCNSGNGSMYYRCYCENFEDEVAPDEQQRCSLVEWVGVEGRRLITIDDELAYSNENARFCGSDDAPDSDEDWSFVDEYCGVRCCSSRASDNGDG
jgi:hypothetical protein